MKPDDTLCYCFHVSKRKVLNYIRINNLKRASQLSDCNGAGSGCGWCVSYLKRCFAEANGDPNAFGDVNVEDYARGRGDYIQAGKGKPPAGAIPPPPIG